MVGLHQFVEHGLHPLHPGNVDQHRLPPLAGGLDEQVSGTEESFEGPMVISLEPGDSIVETIDLIHFGANDLDGTITDGGELTHAYAAEGEVKMTKQEIIEMIERAGFEAVERDTVYNRVEKVSA